MRFLTVPGFPSGAQQERSNGEQHMPDEHDRSRIDVDRADRQVIEQAAARLWQGAIRAGYAGLTVAAGDTDLACRTAEESTDVLRGTQRVLVSV
jgi:hypothetical protein